MKEDIDSIVCDLQAEIMRLEEMKVQITKAQDDLRNAAQSVLLMKEVISHE